MLKKLIIINYLIFLSLTSNCLAQETAEINPGEISSEMKAKQAIIENKGRILTNINKQIYNKSNDSLMKEYVRNSNAMKKIMGKKTKNIDIRDKKALSQYIQDDIGLQKEIIQIPHQETKEKTVRPRAADLLK